VMGAPGETAADPVAHRRKERAARRAHGRERPAHGSLGPRESRRHDVRTREIAAHPPIHVVGVVGPEEEIRCNGFRREESIGRASVLLEEATHGGVLGDREGMPLGKRQRDVIGVVDLEHRGARCAVHDTRPARSVAPIFR